MIRLLLLLTTVALNTTFAADTLTRREWIVDGVVREALLSSPPNAKTKAAPLVFGFHGHGGNMNNAARMYHIHTLWPEAIVVYPQGLNTPGKLTDPEGKKPGWQSGPGDQGDRDLKFFDAMLASLEADFKVDPKRIYSTGHSNGGGFTYLLWAERGGKFAAFGPSAAVAKRTQAGLKPKPVIHIAGENDPLVKFEWQKLMMEAVRKINQCGDGEPWDGINGCTLYPSKIGAPVVAFIHPGTHTYPSEAPALIVKFFKEHALP
ncbi:MAG: dienelactone hydrolase family protein [Chthoniobacteraceae bacterium]